MGQRPVATFDCLTQSSERYFAVPSVDNRGKEIDKERKLLVIPFHFFHYSPAEASTGRSLKLLFPIVLRYYSSS